MERKGASLRSVLVIREVNPMQVNADQARKDISKRIYLPETGKADAITISRHERPAEVFFHAFAASLLLRCVYTGVSAMNA